MNNAPHTTEGIWKKTRWLRSLLKILNCLRPTIHWFVLNLRNCSAWHVIDWEILWDFRLCWFWVLCILNNLYRLASFNISSMMWELSQNLWNVWHFYFLILILISFLLRLLLVLRLTPLLGWLRVILLLSWLYLVTTLHRLRLRWLWSLFSWIACCVFWIILLLFTFAFLDYPSLQFFSFFFFTLSLPMLLKHGSILCNHTPLKLDCMWLLVVNLDKSISIQKVAHNEISVSL